MRTHPSLFTCLLGGSIIIFLILPNIIIVPLSFSTSEYFQFPPPGWTLKWYEAFFSDERWLEAFLRSIRIGAAVSVLSTVLAVSAALALTRGDLPYARFLRALFLAPIVVPNIILAAGLFVLFVKIGVLQTELGIVLAHTVLAAPIVLVTVTVSLRAVKRDLEWAAMSLGAGYLRTFASVTLPQIMPGVATGGVLAFVSSFDETTLTLFLGGVKSMTLPMKMWEGITVESNPVLPAASTIVLVCSTMPIFLLEVWKRLREARDSR